MAHPKVNEVTLEELCLMILAELDETSQGLLQRRAKSAAKTEWQIIAEEYPRDVIDSLDHVGIIMSIESRYNIEIDDDTLDAIQTPSELLAVVNRLRQTD